MLSEITSGRTWCSQNLNVLATSPIGAKQRCPEWLGTHRLAYSCMCCIIWSKCGVQVHLLVYALACIRHALQSCSQNAADYSHLVRLPQTSSSRVSVSPHAAPTFLDENQYGGVYRPAAVNQKAWREWLSSFTRAEAISLENSPQAFEKAGRAS